MRKTNKDYISKHQQEIIIGTVLGDGYLEFNGFHGTRLQIKQQEKYKDYVFWFFDQLKNLCISAPKQRKDNNQWYFSTKSLEKLTNLYQIFYPQGRKKVPKNITELLVSPISLAIWYMDDGCLDFRPKEHYSFILNTDSFTLKDSLLLRKALERNFQIESSVYNLLCRGKRYSKLYIGAQGRDKFLSLIKPYILTDCFSHKIPQL